MVWIKSLATAAQCSFCSGTRSHGTHFAMTCFMPRFYVKISDTVVFGIPRSASSSPTVSCWSSLIAARTRSTFSDILLIAGLPEHGLLSIDSQSSLKHLYHTFIFTALISSSLKAFWIIWIVSTEECSNLMQIFLQICCSTQPFWMQQPHSTQCSFKDIYHTHWPVQWSPHCSCMWSPVHSSWLPGYIDVTQTILIILTMAGFFQTIYTHIYLHTRTICFIVYI